MVRHASIVCWKREMVLSEGGKKLLAQIFTYIAVGYSTNKNRYEDSSNSCCSVGESHQCPSEIRCDVNVIAQESTEHAADACNCYGI